LYAPINPFHPDNYVRGKAGKKKAKLKKAIKETQAQKTKTTIEGYILIGLSPSSLVMLDDASLYHTHEVQVENAIKYHARLEALTVVQMQTFIATLDYNAPTDSQVAKIEKFMDCKMPFKPEELKRVVKEAQDAGVDYSLYIHMAMCGLGSVMGKTDDGCTIGKDCSYFGRFHCRMEEHFKTGML
jgi:hypothetical protein